MTTPHELRTLHRQSSDHRSLIERNSGVSCFYCKKSYSQTDIYEWIEDDQTAICPNCGIDAVLPGFYNKEILEDMHRYWFRDTADQVDPDLYQRNALKTEKTPPFIASGGGRSMAEALRLGRLLHGLVGMCTETGEAQDMVKKHLIYDRPLDWVNVLEEMGDILWYVALTLDAAGYTLSQAMTKNLEKLHTRYGGEFTAEKANNRDLETERLVLELRTGGILKTSDEDCDE